MDLLKSLKSDFTTTIDDFLDLMALIQPEISHTIHERIRIATVFLEGIIQDLAVSPDQRRQLLAEANQLEE